jgi:hypothetical protein
LSREPSTYHELCLQLPGGGQLGQVCREQVSVGEVLDGDGDRHQNASCTDECKVSEREQDDLTGRKTSRESHSTSIGTRLQRQKRSNMMDLKVIDEEPRVLDFRARKGKSVQTERI